VAFPASGASAGRVVLITVDGTRLSDWSSPALPGFGALIRDGAVGLLSTRTADNPVAEQPARASAYRTLGAGRISATASPATLTLAAGGAAVVASADSPAKVLGGLKVPVPGGFTAARSRMRSLVAELLRTFHLVVVDIGDSAMRTSLVRVDSFIAGVRSDLAAGDTLIVASSVPPRDRRDARRYLSAVAMVGPGVRPGSLTSSSTERDGIVTIADIAPTILQRLGVPVPKTMTGRPMHVIPDAHALSDLTGLERALLHASIVRGPLLRATVYVGSAVLLLALVTVLAGMSGGAASAWRAALDTVLIATTAVPLLLMLEPLTGNGSIARTGVLLGAVAIVGAAFLRATAGSRRALAGIFAATALVVLGDLVTGGGLAERSPLSYLIVEGARFHGIGNEAMGVAIAASLFSMAGVLDVGLSRQRLTAAAAILALVAILMAAPRIGDKFGAIPAAIPAFAAFVVLATGRRFDLRAALAIAVVTVLGAALVIVVDRAGGGTHIARAVGGGSGEILGRKAGAASRLLAFSYWMTAIVASVAAVTVLAWRRSSLVGRALWGRPAARRAVVCCFVAMAGSVVANDAGVIAAAWIGLFGGATLVSALLSPDPALPSRS